MSSANVLDNPHKREKSAIPEITEETVRPWIAHDYSTPWPEVPSVIVPDIATTTEDVETAERLIVAYRASAKAAMDYPSIGPDLWSAIMKAQSRFLCLLEGGNARTLAEYLCNMARHDATIGITQGDNEYDWITSSCVYRQFRALLIKDKLVSLAEATGAVPYECPEQGTWGTHMQKECDVLLRTIEKATGLSLNPPSIDGGLLKVVAGDALLHDRDLYAIHGAWAIRNFAGSDARVCEFGGGAGRSAYWASLFGLGPYTIIDLPHINVLQGFYLIKSLPDRKIVLFGEEENDADIIIRPYFGINQVPCDVIDVAFTQDSFPEIHRTMAINYIKWALIGRVRWFYSINQEAGVPYTQDFGELAAEEDPRQTIFRDLIGEIGGYRRFLRTPYWLRKGYSADLYCLEA